MKNNKTQILTVAIPTYKRPKQLEKIIRQLREEKNQNFTLLIADDSMDKTTEEMIKPYLKSMPNLTYHKNQQNLGYSGNVAQLYEMSTTKYIWFLCDDDTVLHGATDKIINAINKYHFVVAVFNCSWVDPFGVKRIAGVEDDIVYNNRAKLRSYNPLMRTTFLSILVVEKRLPVSDLKEKNYKDNIFFQVTLALLLLSDKFLFCEISSKILHRNVGYKYGEFFKFYLVDHIKAISIVKNSFDYKKFIQWSIAQIPTAFQLYLSQKIGLFKYRGSPTKDTIYKIIKYYGIYSILILFFKIFYVLIPSFFLKFSYLLLLIRIHGYKKAKLIYKYNVMRAYRDSRKTGFTAYR